MKRTLLAVALACSLTSAKATIFQYTVSLDGPTEGNASLGTGSGAVNYDDALHTLQVSVTFSGLTVAGSTGVSASHIHAATANPFTGTAGVATPTPTFPGFPSGVYSGSYSNLFDLTLASSWNGAFVTASGGIPQAEAALASAMATGRAYWNIHTSLFPGGEIRGFLVAVPEPSSIGLAGLGAIALLRASNRKRAAR
jgi:hypothetical protein